MPRRPELWLPRRRGWSGWAIGISVFVHALLFLVKIGAYLPPSRLPPAEVYVIPLGAEGERAFDMRYQEPGGVAKRGRAAGITARPEPEAPTPEPERVEARLYGHFALARDAAGGDPRLDASFDWLYEASRRVVAQRTAQLELLPEASR